MTAAITIGAYELTEFVELNIRSIRNIYGDAPVLVYCGAGKNAGKIKEIADRFDCSFLTETKNRMHFQGCLMTAVSAVAFARANQCDVAVKSNQRTVLLSPEIPDLIEAIFDNPNIDLAIPRAPRVETIKDERSRFHSRFKVSPDVICIRANAVDPQMLADKYALQVQTDTSRWATLTEHFWSRMTETEFQDRWSEMPFLTEPTDPPMYLRKCQATSEDYQQAAVRLGMSQSDFPTQEWSAMLGAAYRPLAAFG